jgi:hypothetical protein
MARKGPLLTLLGGGALAGALLVASIVAASGGNDPEPDLAGGQATPTPTPTPEATPEATEAPEENVEPVTYVGYVDGGGASVAIIIDGDEATAYVCDGATVEVWLNGPAFNGELLLTGDNGELVGSYDEAQATGRTVAFGREWTFTIEEVAPPEGLYQFADTVVGGAEVEGGWIVLPDGTQVGVLTVDGESGPAPALDLATGQVEIEGTTVTVERRGAGG